MMRKNSSDQVQFEGEYTRRSAYAQRSRSPKIIRWVKKHFGAKNDRQAYYVIFGFIAVAIVVSLFLLSNIGTEIEEHNIFDPATAEPDINDMPNR